jgi:signal peptidase I
LKSEQVIHQPQYTEEENSQSGSYHIKTTRGLHEKPSLYLFHGDELLLSRKVIIDLMAEILSKGKDFRFRARGWSMTPFIKDGDIISISPIGNNKPKTGEIVAFNRPEVSGLVVHRLIGTSQDMWMIQGDNTPEEKMEFVPEDRILGRVTRVQREGKDVWSGIGPERYLIALLSRLNLLGPMLFQARNFHNRINKNNGVFRGKQ